MKLKFPVIKSNFLCVFIAIYVIAISNYTFFRKTFDYFETTNIFIVYGFIITIFLWAIAASLAFFSSKYTLKPAAIIAIMTGSISGYFVDTYGVIIDRSMITSTLATTTQEAGELMTPEFAFRVALTGLLPCLLVLFARVDYQSGWKTLRNNGVVIMASLLFSGAIVMSNYSAYSSTVRNHRDLMKSLNPMKPIFSVYSYAKHRAKNINRVLKPLGTDAHKKQASAPGKKRRLTVIVIGETARAKSFSLNGYDRETNPELKKRGVINFNNVSSCGTHTGTSVPCMFSILNRSNYDETTALYTENLTDIVSRAGMDVKWWSNNTSSSGVADRIAYESVYYIDEKPYCTDEAGCFDEILIDRLEKHLATLDNDAVLVVHQSGSHGPAYFRRVPPPFKTFKPGCESPQFSKCTQDQIINSYDNTIVYTDHVLSKLIDLLKANSDRFDTAMIYMSDHGESTGEFGLYLHGMIYMLAPSEQTWVPFITWISDGFAAAAKLDLKCLRSRENDSLSHDNLFHSVLGLMDIETQVYNKSLDIFSACRTNKPV